jgi:hypothetical protein
MTPKQTVPLAITLAPAIAGAPAIMIGGAICLGIAWLVKSTLDSGKNPSPETDTSTAEPDTIRKQAETAAFRQIPAVIPTKSVPHISAPPARSVPRVVVQPVVAQPVPTGSVAVQPAAPVAKTISPAKSQPDVKKFITRADIAAIFENGKRAMSRTAAVTALQRLGFGKSAAYAALSPGGRFSSWLSCAPDGIISWTDAQNS